MKVLFLLKERNSYGGLYSVMESGLLNSAKMTMEALRCKFGFEVDLKVCFDANSIDKHLTAFRPKVAVIEAIWVTPKKLRELEKLHPKVHFIVRIHSETPFLANEGNSVEWGKEYSKIPRTYVAFNSERTKKDFNNVTDLHFYYLPNIYEDVRYKSSIFSNFEKPKKIPRTIDIGCFGAIRPMKNQLEQAVAALSLGNKHDSIVFFHINAPRIEQGGQSVLKNLRNLFADTRHVLVEHPWLKREEFLDLVETMDIGMQVSLNESFNIVTADFIKMNTPIIVSKSISWMPEITQVDTEETKEIVRGLEYGLTYPRSFVKASKKHLVDYNDHAVDVWYNFFYD